MQLRNYQTDIAKKGTEILNEHKIVYLCMEVRTGKTLTALKIAESYGNGINNVLFVTKKKAIEKINKDFNESDINIGLEVTNYEQLSNVLEYQDLYNVIILDEAHCIGQYPRPAERTKILKEICKDKPIIYLSGTPSPESYAQFYHQFWISSYSPWNDFHTFYKWHKAYGIRKVKFIYNRAINDYSNVITSSVLQDIRPFVLTYTQEEAGFECPVIEEIIKVPMSISQKDLVNKIKKDKIAYINDKVITADTAVKEMQKIHQICSGTVIFDNGDYDNIKGSGKPNYLYFSYLFTDKKKAIFYKYIAEGILLKELYKNNIYTDPIEFSNAGSDAVFISQISSGREGIDLSTADCLIMYNIDFSAVSYWQARARLQTKDRVKPAIVYWLFTEGGIEEEIYKVVQGKKDFTLSHYKKI